MKNISNRNQVNQETQDHAQNSQDIEPQLDGANKKMFTELKKITEIEELNAIDYSQTNALNINTIETEVKEINATDYGP